MNWLNLRTEILHSPEFIGSDPIRRATWLSLSLWCAQQENGGRIVGGAKWPDRRWQQTAGVTADEATCSCELYRVVDDDVVLWGYNADKEVEVQAKRNAGRSRAAKRWGNSSATSSATSSVYTEGEGEGEGEGERKENEKEKGMQGEEAGPATPPASAADALALTSEPPTKPAKAKRAPKAAPQTDAEWLASLAASPAYAGMDVAREHAKASEWCRVRSQPLSRQRFVNWLNRADKPLTASNGSATSRRAFSDSNDYSSVKF